MPDTIHCRCDKGYFKARDGKCVGTCVLLLLEELLHEQVSSPISLGQQIPVNAELWSTNQRFSVMKLRNN